MAEKLLIGFCIFLFLLFEYPLVKRFIQYKNNFELSRLIAVCILMAVFGGFIFAIYQLGLTLLKLL